MKNKDFIKDYVKASRRLAREEEIEMYGKPINHKHVKQSEKTYKRKKFKYHNEDY
jgi:hypothetical protein